MYLAGHRFTNHFGEEYARLANDQSILDVNVPDQTIVFQLFNLAGFYIPELYCERFNELWVDRMVVSVRWTAFVNLCLEEWKRTLFIVSTSIDSSSTDH